MSLIQTALSLDVGESESHRIMGALNLFKRDFERAETHIQQSLALNPNDAHIAVKAGTYFSFSGQANAALASVDRAMRLNPHHPEWYWTELGLAHHTAGDYGAAITALLHNTSPSFLALAILSASYVETGRMAEARATAKTLAEVKPNATLTYFLKRMPYKRAKDLDRLVTALRQAGIPEN